MPPQFAQLKQTQYICRNKVKRDMTSIPNCNRQCDYCHCALCEERKPQESVAYTISATDIKGMRQREREHYMSLSKEQLVDIIMGGNDYLI